MQQTIGDLRKLLEQRKQSFFMYRGIPYDIVEEFQDDDGKWFVRGVNNDGEEATEEIFMPFSQGTEVGAPTKNTL